MLQVPELEFPSFDRLEVPSFPDLSSLELDPAAFARFTLSNPPAAVAASVAAYVVIPRAAKVLTKYVLIPAVVLAVLAAVAEDPAGAAAAASAAGGGRRPTETSAIGLGAGALALSHILLAALLAPTLSGALPEKLSTSKLAPRGSAPRERARGRRRRSRARARRRAPERARGGGEGKAQAEQAERARGTGARARGARDGEAAPPREGDAARAEQGGGGRRARRGGGGGGGGAEGELRGVHDAVRARGGGVTRSAWTSRGRRKRADAERTRERKAQADRLRAESARRLAIRRFRDDLRGKFWRFQRYVAYLLYSIRSSEPTYQTMSTAGVCALRDRQARRRHPARRAAPRRRRAPSPPPKCCERDFPSQLLVREKPLAPGGSPEGDALFPLDAALRVTGEDARQSRPHVSPPGGRRGGRGARHRI